MKKSYYIIAGVVSIILIAVIVLIVQFNNGNDDTNTSKEKPLEETYSDKQIKMAKQRKALETDVDKKVQEYIKKTQAPKSQQEYDEALKMRNEEDRKNLSEDVKDIVKDDKREVKNLNTELHFKDSKTVEGTYYYTLVTSKDDKTNSEDKSGDFTLKTNKDGYLYIKDFS
ncbi:hypothetical protein [Staphylococcus haemolyticus]|uniref:hypothetical protein n=1 Tax=Staphylococcus haemolyticus TaxID=1283 RepID=UPI0011A300E9|nr:hypothetical protein [Staphylococcus haemolyticus]